MRRTRNIDEVLHRMVEPELASEAEADRDWARLQQAVQEAQRAKVRRRRRNLTLAGAFGLVLLCVGLWRDVGTEDFVLIPGRPGDQGERIFHSRHRPLSFNSVGDTLSEDQTRQLGEEMYSKFEAREGTLTRVYGLTIGGLTHLTPYGEVQTSFGPRGTNLNLPIEPDDPQTKEFVQAQLLFLHTRLAEVKRAIASGQAPAIEAVDVPVGGRIVRCQRWQFAFPELGTVVYWDSGPLHGGS